MFSKQLLTSSLLVLLSSTLTSAQTHSDCNPVKGQTCKPDPAFGGTYEIDFTKGASDVFTVADGTTLEYDASKGAVFTINKETDAPTITSSKYIFFGSVEVVVQAASGTGIVTSFVLQSDDLDEIDWEWLGGDKAQVQTNYFSKGDTTTYDRGGFSPVSNPQDGFHTYTIDWSQDAVVWSIDGTAVRTLTYNDAKGGTTFPQSPMQVKLGTWVGGASSNSQGTIDWAGGLTPFGNGNGPYIGYYKSLKIVDKSNGVSGATSYSYGDTSGTFSSIKISTDGSSGNSTDTTSSSSATTATASATKSGSASGSASTSVTATGSKNATGSKTATTATTATGATTGTAGTTVGTTGVTSASSADATSIPITTGITGGAFVGTGTAGTTLATATVGSNTTVSTGRVTAPNGNNAPVASSPAVVTSSGVKAAVNLISVAGALAAAYMML